MAITKTTTLKEVVVFPTEDSFFSTTNAGNYFHNRVNCVG